MRPDLLLVTCTAWSEGEPGHQALDAALVEAGISARWVCWDDPGVDWAGSLVAVRSAWDYHDRLGAFLAWARSVPRLVNGEATFAWNADKAYLTELAAAGLPVVPTLVVESEEDLPAAIAATWELGQAAVVKPRVGAGGAGVTVFDGTDGGPPGLDEAGLEPGPWVVQPLVRSIRTEGETSVFVLGGEPVSMVRKLPVGDEIRVNEQYGGTTLAAVPTEEATTRARHAVRVAERILGEDLGYARVDLIRLDDGVLALSELELVEPGLYLEELPANGIAFAALVAGMLAG